MYVGRIEKLLAYYSPLPMCIVNAQGKVTRASSKIAEVFKYDGIVDYDIFALTGIKMPEFIKAAEEDKPLYIQRNDKKFRIGCSFLGGDPEEKGEEEGLPIIMIFSDVTAYEKLKELYNSERVYMLLVNVDNFDELSASTTDAGEVKITAEIERFIRDWAAGMGAMIVKYRDNLYELAITHRNYEQLVADKFSVLDKIKEIESDADFPVTLSIGIGLGAKTLAEADDYAQEALDLALGRGGDQAVVKNVKNFQYFGGGVTSVEKRNKGKSRIIGHALNTLMSQASQIFIMGHKNPDMDCFGASLGVHRLASLSGKDTYIILGENNESMTDIIADARETGEYQFISEEKALSLVDKNSLVIVVDAHRPMLVESLRLVELVDKLAVIDHHRKAEDYLPNQTLSYMESYASSASELVTEILQYIIDRKNVSTMEANALLAGIMLDTNRFAVKAGVRTFEAASWLKRAGADLQHVRRYFQDNAENFRARAEGIANARIIDGTIAMSICEGQTINTQITNSQVADELLTIKGIEASFVAGRNEKGQTVVSARSLGNINVQYVMEHFGGGGHMNTAGVRTDLAPEKILADIEDYLHKSNTIGG
ncbi:MAG: DHH family phosphoesterase [Bacillota bacterium]|nr:DHH family phosphoesterase [Bacillota bacterium]